MGILLLNLIITAALYCGPILFLRYVVFRKKINKNRALVYVLISTIIVFIGIQVFTDYMYGTTSSNGAPAGFWGFVCYFILADTKKRDDAEDSSADQEPPKTPPVVQISKKKPSKFSSDRKHNLLLFYSLLMTILTIVFLGLTIKFYNNYQQALSPHHFYRLEDGRLRRVIGYYTSSGELIPFDSED